jgi:hypothetical protein
MAEYLLRVPQPRFRIKIKHSHKIRTLSKPRQAALRGFQFYIYRAYKLHLSPEQVTIYRAEKQPYP